MLKVCIEDSVLFVLSEFIYAFDPGMNTLPQGPLPVSSLTVSMSRCSPLLRNHDQVRDAANLGAFQCLRARAVFYALQYDFHWEPFTDMTKVHLGVNESVYRELAGCILNPLSPEYEEIVSYITTVLNYSCRC